jgi:hypothetical protein
LCGVALLTAMTSALLHCTSSAGPTPMETSLDASFDGAVGNADVLLDDGGSDEDADNGNIEIDGGDAGGFDAGEDAEPSDASVDGSMPRDAANGGARDGGKPVDAHKADSTTGH